MGDRIGDSRRGFLRVAASSALLAPLGAAASKSAGAAAFRAPNDRPRLALIGAGGQGSGDARRASRFGDFLAVCDVDKNHVEAAKADQRIGKGKAETYGDYRKVLDRDDIDAVVIGTPDHWHTKICVEAMKAGKDVYCEKPLTLTIDEGKILCRVTEETKRVLQVGTQQRSDHNKVFMLAVALVRAGRIGKIKKVTAAIGSAPSGGPFAKETPPPELNWDMWLGQAPKVDYIKERCHYEFRWWYEYSGGKLTDWGAHHVDVAHWGLGLDDTENGVRFEGEHGRIFVTRDRIDLDGGAVPALYRDPIPESLLKELRHGKPMDDHFENFFACCNDRGKPVSDVWSHHRAMTTCHLANIAIRLGGRKLNWDPEKEQIIGDEEANSFLSRPQRAGYEIKA